MFAKAEKSDSIKHWGGMRKLILPVKVETSKNHLERQF